jgi:hypothetical protein
MRAEFQDKIDKYTTVLRAAPQDEKLIIKDEFDSWYGALTEIEKEEIRPYWKAQRKRVDQMLKEAWELIEELKAVIEKEKREGLSETSA